MTKEKSKFSVGDPVNHPAGPPGTFPAGTGTIASINVDGSYKVKCDATGNVLFVDFQEDVLSPNLPEKAEKADAHAKHTKHATSEK